MDISTAIAFEPSQQQRQDASTNKGRRKGKKEGDDGAKKRRCISSACVPCRKRKSKVCFQDPAASIVVAKNELCLSGDAESQSLGGLWMGKFMAC
jgi:hypothetical protein